MIVAEINAVIKTMLLEKNIFEESIFILLFIIQKIFFQNYLLIFMKKQNRYLLMVL